MEDVKNLKVKVEIEKIKHCFTTGECGDRTEPGVFYDGNDLAWRNGVVGLAKHFLVKATNSTGKFGQKGECAPTLCAIQAFFTTLRYKQFCILNVWAND